MKHLEAILKNYKNVKVTVVGDVMLDRSIFVDVKRISPEAPVLIARVISDDNIAPGGAGNVAANIKSLSGNVSLFGLIGKDAYGEQFCKMMKDYGIPFFPSYCDKTIRKTRVISGNHQLIRLDHEEDSTKPLEHDSLEKEAKGSDILVVSDYAKGAISRELMEQLKSYSKKIIVDPKPSNCHLYEGVYLIKFNESEAFAASLVKDVHESGNILSKRFGSNILITRGPKGMLLFNEGVKEFPTFAREVYDVTGAGDTALAALALSLASGASLEDSAILSNYAAGLAVEKTGTAMITLSELEKRIFKEESKIKNPEELREIIQGYQKKAKKVVWTNGCFGHLHDGHVKYLKKAKSYGDILIVGINSDESIKRIKGESIRPQDARLEIISSLECVDYTLLFNDDTAIGLLGYLKPDVFVKADNPRNTINQEEVNTVQGYGGKFSLIPLNE